MEHFLKNLFLRGRSSLKFSFSETPIKDKLKIVFSSGTSDYYCLIESLNLLILMKDKFKKRKNEIEIKFLLPKEALDQNDQKDIMLKLIFLKILEEIKEYSDVEVISCARLSKVNQGILMFEDGHTYKYDYCFFHPEQRSPSIITRGAQFQEALQRNNVFIIGDALNSAKDRPYFNCLIQSIALANNLKCIHYNNLKLETSKLTYSPYSLHFIPISSNEFAIYNFKNNEVIKSVGKLGAIKQKAMLDFFVDPFSMWSKIFIRYVLGSEWFKIFEAQTTLKIK